MLAEVQRGAGGRRTLISVIRFNFGLYLTAFSPNRIGEYDSYCRIYLLLYHHVRSGTVGLIVVYQYSVREAIGKRLGTVSCDTRGTTTLVQKL